MRNALLLCLALAACAPVPMDPLRAADFCEERARAAQGPTGQVTIGVNSNSGAYTDAAIGVTSDYLSGRDPMEVYRTCVFERTGGDPIRPPRLR